PHHAVGMNPVVGLGWPVDASDVTYRCGPQPHLEITHVGQVQVISANRVLQGSPHDRLGTHDAVPGLAAPFFNPLVAGPDRPVSDLLRHRWRVVDEELRVSVYETH